MLGVSFVLADSSEVVPGEETLGGLVPQKSQNCDFVVSERNGLLGGEVLGDQGPLRLQVDSDDGLVTGQNQEVVFEVGEEAVPCLGLVLDFFVRVWGFDDGLEAKGPHGTVAVLLVKSQKETIEIVSVYSISGETLISVHKRFEMYEYTLCGRFTKRLCTNINKQRNFNKHKLTNFNTCR